MTDKELDQWRAGDDLVPVFAQAREANRMRELVRRMANKMFQICGADVRIGSLYREAEAALENK